MSTSSPGPLEADSGGLATHAYHAINLGLAVATPLYFILPIENGIFGKVFGVALAGSMSAHSWVGLNYVGAFLFFVCLWFGSFLFRIILRWFN